MYLLMSLFCLYYILLYLQEYHYHLDSFSKILKREIKNKYNYLFVLSLVGYFSYISFYINIIVFLLFLIVVIIKIEEKRIIKLKYTRRIILNIIVNLIVYLVVYIFFYRFVVFLPFFSLFISFISFLILMPFHFLEKYYYFNKAKNKLNRIKPLVIAITGSAGKTSIKHFIYHIIKNKYNCFMTKGSVNTAMGIAMAINNEMNDCCEVAIIECGISRRGDIDEILKVIYVDISIISTIFPQHLETFKCFEQLVYEKAKLSKTGLLHIGLDTIVNNLYYSGASNVMIIGDDFKLTDYKTNEYFKFKMKSNNKEYTFKTKVLGKNNIINILFSICVSNYLGLSMEYIKNQVRTLENVSNRLNVRCEYSKKIIDDSFNSNYYGFCDALDIINLMEKNRCVITPGIVSGGSYIKEYNQKIAMMIISKCDYCILVESIVSNIIKEVFDRYLFDYHYVSNFKDGYLKAINNQKIKTILIENDITDIYKF